MADSTGDILTMEPKEFKALFSDVAEHYGYSRSFGGWFSESPECIFVLDLQKSNYGNYFELNLKIFVHGLFGKHYVTSKDLVKKETGDVFLRAPDTFQDTFDLDKQINRTERAQWLRSLFEEFIVPLTIQALTRSGLLKLGESGTVLLLPAVQNELIKATEM